MLCIPFTKERLYVLEKDLICKGNAIKEMSEKLEQLNEKVASFKKLVKRKNMRIETLITFWTKHS